ncbi:MAG: VTT domain-containing protein [Phycisphaerales bacterium]|nr:VTT domain-containing protein [Phycisphaerales bacterium]
MSEHETSPPPASPAPDAEPAAPSESASQIFQKLGAAGYLAIAAAVMPAIGGIALLGTLNITGPWLRSHEVAGWLLYVVCFVVLAGLALLPTYAQAVLGGWAFGFAWGFPGALLGFVGGSLVGYFVARRASGDRVMNVVHEHPKWSAVRDALVGQGFWKTLGIVTLLRLPPNSPFALTNLVMASVQVKLPAFVLGTLIGMAPRTAGAVYVASLIQGELTSDTAKAARPGWFIPVTIASTVVVLIIVGSIANRALKKATNAQRSTPATPPGTA